MKSLLSLKSSRIIHFYSRQIKWRLLLRFSWFAPRNTFTVYDFLQWRWNKSVKTVPLFQLGNVSVNGVTLFPQTRVENPCEKFPCFPRHAPSWKFERRLVAPPSSRRRVICHIIQRERCGGSLWNEGISWHVMHQLRVWIIPGYCEMECGSRQVL